MTQVLAKATMQKAMIYGVPFFVATLVKNAKMVPVMLGAIVMSGKSYALQKYLQVNTIFEHSRWGSRGRGRSLSPLGSGRALFV
jgi:hypothetical protein